MAAPVAVASIQLSEDERKRIAKELQLEDDQLDAVPTKLDIARYSDEEVGDDVQGFLFNSFQSPSLSTQPTTFGTPQLSFGKIPGGILVPL